MSGSVFTRGARISGPDARAGYGHAKGVEFSFILKKTSTVCLPPRHIPQMWHEVVDAETDKMLRDKVIQLSISPYCTYPVLAAKKDGGVRFAIDYRRLNSLSQFLTKCHYLASRI